MSNTKIIVLRSKQLIYVGVLIALGILLFLALFFITRSKSNSGHSKVSSISHEIQSNSKTSNQISSPSNIKYKPGLYTSAFALGNATINLEIAVDKNHINSIKLKNISKSISTMYPLIKPSIKNIEKQLKTGVSPDEVVLSKNSQYTEKLILDSITTALSKAKVQ